MKYALHLVIQIATYGLAALGLSLCVGHAGLLSMAQAAAFAAGGYTYALLTVAYGFAPALALAGSLACGLGFAALLGAIARILEDDEFVFGTLAFAVLIGGLAQNWYSADAPLGSWRNLTNGPFGVSNVPPLPTPGLAQQVPLTEAFLGVAVVGLFVTGAQFALRSPWGQLLHAVRDAPALARSLGKRVVTERGRVMELCTWLGFAAGALWISHARYVDAEVARVELSVFFLTAVLLGGASTLWGPLLGAAALVLLPEALRWVGVGTATIASLRVVLYGLVLLALFHIRPRGLAGWASRRMGGGP